METIESSKVLETEVIGVVYHCSNYAAIVRAIQAL